MEKVHVERDWYDGPRNGIADFNGVPHRFAAHFDDLKGYEDTFSLFPIPKSELEMEIEQWKIYVEWNERYEKGEADVDTHPGHGGVNDRWDEIENILKQKRKVDSPNAIKAKATFKDNGQQNRYAATGPSYGVVWKVIYEPSNALAAE